MAISFDEHRVGDIQLISGVTYIAIDNLKDYCDNCAGDGNRTLCTALGDCYLITWVEKVDE